MSKRVTINKQKHQIQKAFWRAWVQIDQRMICFRNQIELTGKEAEVGEVKINWDDDGGDDDFSAPKDDRGGEQVMSQQKSRPTIKSGRKCRPEVDNQNRTFIALEVSRAMIALIIDRNKKFIIFGRNFDETKFNQIKVFEWKSNRIKGMKEMVMKKKTTKKRFKNSDETN